MRLNRLVNNPFVKWWWSLDRTTYALLVLLMVLGGAIMATASVAVVETYNVDTYYFARRQAIFLLASLVLMNVFALLGPTGVKRVGLLMLPLAVAGVVATLFMGADVKGAHRWVYVAGFSLQPTEFLKPAFVILTAAFLSQHKMESRMRGFVVSGGVLAMLGALILSQPDFGMTMLLSIVWGVQVFLSGISLMWLAPLAFGGLLLLAGGYMLMPHVRSRLERFLDPASGDTYQVDQGREAFLNGGLFGQGLGEGTEKYQLPDAHTDFIFAVIGEEFGIIACLLLLAVYATIVVRSFWRIRADGDLFVRLAGLGLVSMFALQVLINMGVVLQVLPTTGMTLPFISYGGSSTTALAIAAGMILALSCKRGRPYKGK